MLIAPKDLAENIRPDFQVRALSRHLLKEKSRGTGCDAYNDLQKRPFFRPTERGETRNSSQLSLSERGIALAQCPSMTLVGVDLTCDYVREVGTLCDGRPSMSSSNLRRPSSLSQDQVSDDSMYIDIHTDSYRSFGQDVSLWVLSLDTPELIAQVAYMGGKAFTRRMFKRDVQTGSFSFLSPWQGEVLMQNQYHVRDTIKSVHIPYGKPLQRDLTSELRCNFSAIPKSSQNGGVYHRQNSFQAETVRKIARGLPRQALDVAHSSTNRRWSAISVGSLERHWAPYPRMELAQERLGGGRGDDAKLAKLIVYPFGQDFIDLLVAANLLVFNRIYEHAMQRL